MPITTPPACYFFHRLTLPDYYGPGQPCVMFAQYPHPYTGAPRWTCDQWQARLFSADDPLTPGCGRVPAPACGPYRLNS